MLLSSSPPFFFLLHRPFCPRTKRVGRLCAAAFVSFVSRAHTHAQRKTSTSSVVLVSPSPSLPSAASAFRPPARETKRAGGPRGVDALFLLRWPPSHLPLDPGDPPRSESRSRPHLHPLKTASPRFFFLFFFLTAQFVAPNDCGRTSAAAAAAAGSVFWLYIIMYVCFLFISSCNYFCSPLRSATCRTR